MAALKEKNKWGLRAAYGVRLPIVISPRGRWARVAPVSDSVLGFHHGTTAVEILHNDQLAQRRMA
ncbi:hypothetical protein Thiowin_02638 [Thiorhodovibrio winogradskyi]|uniref:Uncharacterized protein n=1 Tax=Thiorhodovibrio winogradskyi TaxID=77007 RepID=A0ABZ0SAD7_9GAMM